MPDFVLNCAGITRTTGTADPVIISGTGKSRSLADVPDGTEIAYYRRYKSSKAGFENAIGIWRVQVTATSIGYIDRTSVEASSNDDAPVVWGVGEQWIDVAANLSMLESLSAGDLDPATTLTGTEIAFLIQGGDGVQSTPQAISGTPVTDVTSLAFNRVQGYSRFDRTRVNFQGTDAALCDLEPYTAYKAAGGLIVQYAVSTISPSCFVVSTGTATNEYACIRHSVYPIFFDPTLEYIDIFAFTVTALPSVEAYTFQSGFIVGAPALASQGMYLQLSAADAQFQCVVKGAGGETLVDTGITAAIAPTKYVRKIHYDPTAPASTKFYINGALVGTILNTDRVVATNQLLGMATSIRKSAGVNPASFVTDSHYYDIAPFEGRTLEYFE